jgi:hypothetical protein
MIPQIQFWNIGPTEIDYYNYITRTKPLSNHIIINQNIYQNNTSFYLFFTSYAVFYLLSKIKN